MPLHPRVFRLINSIQAWDIWPVHIRTTLLKLAGVSISGKVAIMAGCDFKPGQIAIGDGAFINKGCLIDGTGGVSIGERAFIGYRAQLITITHQIGSSLQRARVPRVEKPVNVEQGCWIGAGAIVLPGVHVGAGTVVGAGAVVVGTLPSDCLAVGMPARMLRELPSD